MRKISKNIDKELYCIIVLYFLNNFIYNINNIFQLSFLSNTLISRFCEKN